MPSETVGDIMNEFGMLELSSEETGDSASGRILSGRVGIVRAPASIPVGVLTRKSYFALRGLGEALGEHRDLLAPVCLTTPETKLIQVVKVVAENPGVNWFLAMQEGSVAGYIAPSMLFHLIRASKDYGQVFVKPGGGAATECYCCQPQPPDSKHEVSAADAEKNRYGGVKLCPTHNFPLIPKSPCDGNC